MSNVVEGINEEELGTLSFEILDYADRISEILDKIDLCMEKLPNFYQGTPSNDIIERYKELTTYYPIIKSNIASYSDDLIELMKKMNENDKYLTSLFQNYTDDIISKVKSIMN